MEVVSFTEGSLVATVALNASMRGSSALLKAPLWPPSFTDCSPWSPQAARRTGIHPPHLWGHSLAKWISLHSDHLINHFLPVYETPLW